MRLGLGLIGSSLREEEKKKIGFIKAEEWQAGLRFRRVCVFNPCILADEHSSQNLTHHGWLCHKVLGTSAHKLARALAHIDHRERDNY